MEAASGLASKEAKHPLHAAFQRLGSQMQGKAAARSTEACAVQLASNSANVSAAMSSSFADLLATLKW